MDSNLSVLGIGHDPRIFKGTQVEVARESSGDERPALTYSSRWSNDLLIVLDLLDLLDLFF